MKKISGINYLLIFLTSLISLNIRPLYSSATTLNCVGQIPNKTACLIEANKLKLRIRRIDICQKNPFPSYRSTADYSGSKCINLFNEKITGQNYLEKSKKFNIPKTLFIEKGEYKYITIILENKFTVSGKYNAGNYFWATSKEGPKNIIQSQKNISNPDEFTTKLTSWRGKKNLDNKYCENNGGTKSRCDVQYNGYRMLGVGLDSDFVETSGKKTKYLFFMSELSPTVNLDNNTKGFFKIDFKKNLEVFGNKLAVKSISIAPFQFRARFISEN